MVPTYTKKVMHNMNCATLVCVFKGNNLLFFFWSVKLIVGRWPLSGLVGKSTESVHAT